MNSKLEKLPLVFNAYKPVGKTSFGAVAHFKKNLNYKFGKIGHFGTLDPFAEGVLLIGVQGAQRINNFVHEFMPKTYWARGIFGGKTDTGDNTAEVNLEKDIDDNFKHVSVEDLEELFREEFLGEYWQAPHSVSAVKYNGQRLYKLARQGKFIQMDKKKREILEFRIHSFNYPYLDFEVTVSSGTYIRSLFEEMSELLGGVGHLELLKRTAIGKFKSDDSLTFDAWPLRGEDFNIQSHGHPIDEVLELDKAFLDEAQTTIYLHGKKMLFSELNVQATESKDFDDTGLFWVYSYENVLMGLCRNVEDIVKVEFNLNFYTLGYQ